MAEQKAHHILHEPQQPANVATTGRRAVQRITIQQEKQKAYSRFGRLCALPLCLVCESARRVRRGLGEDPRRLYSCINNQGPAKREGACEAEGDT